MVSQHHGRRGRRVIVDEYRYMSSMSIRHLPFQNPSNSPPARQKQRSDTAPGILHLVNRKDSDTRVRFVPPPKKEIFFQEMGKPWGYIHVLYHLSRQPPYYMYLFASSIMIKPRLLTLAISMTTDLCKERPSQTSDTVQPPLESWTGQIVKFIAIGCRRGELPRQKLGICF